MSDTISDTGIPNTEMEKNKIRVACFISGKGSNLKRLIEHHKYKLESGLKSNCDISLVISSREDAGGLVYARQNSIPIAYGSYKTYIPSEFKRLSKEIRKKTKYLNLDRVYILKIDMGVCL